MTCIKATIEIKLKDGSSGTYADFEDALLEHFGTNRDPAAMAQLPKPYDSREVLLTQNLSNGAYYCILRDGRAVPTNLQSRFTFTALIVGEGGDRQVEDRLVEFHRSVCRKRHGGNLEIHSQPRYELFSVDADSRIIEGHPFPVRCVKPGPSRITAGEVAVLAGLALASVGFFAVGGISGIVWLQELGWVTVGAFVAEAIGTARACLRFSVDVDIDAVADAGDALAGETRTGRVTSEYAEGDSALQTLARPEGDRANRIMAVHGGVAAVRGPFDGDVS